MKRLIGWILSSSIFAACCALALLLAAERLLLALNPVAMPCIDYDIRARNHPLHLLVFGSTLIEYNAHFLLNAPRGAKGRLTPWLLALTGSILCAMALPGMPVAVLVLVGALALLAVVYSAPYLPFRPKRRINDLGITKILVLTLTWVVMTTVVPALYLGLSWHAAGAELVLRFLLIFPLCLAFDLRDYESDLSKGIQTVAGALGEARSYRLIDGCLALLVLAGLICCGLRYIGAWHLVALLAAAVSARLAIAFARRTGHPYAYVGLIDGVMLLYGILVWLLA